MTITQPKQDAIRVGLAEWRGWSKPYSELPKCWKPPEGDTLAWSARDGNPLPNPFDPLTGLGVCHEYEARLTEEQREEYIDTLMNSISSSSSTHWDCTHADQTARAVALWATVKGK